MIIFAVVVTSYSLLRFQKLTNNFSRYRFLATVQSKALIAFNTIYYYRKHKMILLYSLLISIVFILFGAFSNYLYFLSIGIKIPVLALIQVYTIVRLAGMFPISINSLGISEGLYIVLFGIIGISSVNALTVALLARVLLMLASLSGGIVFMFKGRSDKA
jgi:uncharacterized protein (TIRG00374 family)